MTQDEIIEMWDEVVKYAPSEVRIADFAKLVAEKATAKEREACARVCETLELPEWPDKVRQPLAQAIRARGTHD